MKNKHKIVTLVAGVIAVGSVIAPTFAFAQGVEASASSSSLHSQIEMGGKSLSKNHAQNNRTVNGKVVSVNGSIITLTNKKNVVYTIDATNAKFAGKEIGDAFTLASILPNDEISVRGTVTGTNVVATSISDKSYTDRTIFPGKVVSVSGSTITLMKDKNTTYTVNVGSATVTKGFGKNSKTISISDIAVGDRLAVIGSLAGTVVTPTSIQDMGNMGGGMHAKK